MKTMTEFVGEEYVKSLRDFGNKLPEDLQEEYHCILTDYELDLNGYYSKGGQE